MKEENEKELRERQEKELVRAYFDFKKSGVFVEVGANEPVSPSSQSWHLEEKLNWSGLLIEPNPDLAQKAKKNRPKSVVCECACTSPEKVGPLTLYIPVKNGQSIAAHAAVAKNIDMHNYKDHAEVRVQAGTLDHLLEKHNVGLVDLLSIDVEGAELDVLRGLDLKKHSPALILLEDKHVYLFKHRHLKKHGYQLVKRTKQNCWYVPKGAKRPPQRLSEKIKIWKRLYVSIWWKKIRLALR